MSNKFIKIGSVFVALFITVLSSFCIISAKADNNTPSTDEKTYTEFTIPIPGNLYDQSTGGSRNYYTIPFFRFRIFSFQESSQGLTCDTLYYYNVQNKSFQTVFLYDSTPSFGVTTWYSMQTPSTSKKEYGSVTIEKSRTSSGLCSGAVTSYDVGTNLTAPYNMFYIRFNFTGGGYKQYTFENFQFNPYYPLADFPIRYNLTNVIYGSQQSYSEGYNNGYNDGYNAGDTHGNTLGYNKGYKDGYTEGRQAPQYSFKEFFLGFGDSFITIFNSILDYDFLGINVAALVGTVVVVAVIVVFIKKFLSK